MLTTRHHSGARIEAIDILRGFALMGIVVAHMSDSYFASLRLPEWQDFDKITPADHWLNHWGFVLISGKFFTIFSLLFGLSFSIQMDSAARKGANFLGRFSWRLVLLMGIGAVHQAFYAGDILIIYAFLGFVLLLFRNRSDKTLLIWATLLSLNTPMLVLRSGWMGGQAYQDSQQAQADTVQAQQNNYPPELVAQAQDYYQIMQSGTWSALAASNYQYNLSMKVGFQIFSGRLFITLGMFLFGLYAGRKGYFAQLAEHLHPIRKWFWISLLAGLVPTLVEWWLWQDTMNGTGGPMLQWLGALAMDLSNFAFTFAYITGVLWAILAGAKGLQWLAPLGKMGLTTYLTQTAFGVWLLYPYGLGLMFEIGIATKALYGLLFFVLQIFLSNIWLQYFNNGPVEWLWRCLTYLRWMPLRKKKM